MGWVGTIDLVGPGEARDTIDSFLQHTDHTTIPRYCFLDIASCAGLRDNPSFLEYLGSILFIMPYLT